MSSADFNALPNSAAAGEERAMRSFGYQYEMVATYTYRAIVEGNLRHVWIGDRQAGRADDGVLWIGSEIRGIQAKYSSGNSYLTFRDFCKLDDGRSLAGDLYNGFASLRLKFPDRPIFVYLTTSQRPSHADTVPGTSLAFEGFIADGLPKVIQTGRLAFPDAFDRLAAATGDPADLLEFLSALRFDFNALPDNRNASSSETRARDVEDLAAFYLSERTQPTAGPNGGVMASWEQIRATAMIGLRLVGYYWERLAQSMKFGQPSATFNFAVA